MSEITADKFEDAVGRPPEGDDLERCNCDQAGKLMHWSCGWCENCNMPQFMCGCYIKEITNNAQ